MTVVIGLDAATRDIRALAVDAGGTVIASAQRPLPPPSRPRPGWSEQDPAYAETALAVLRQVAVALAGRPVAGIAITATSGTVVPCDANGVPVGPALLYDDRRAATEPGLAPLAQTAPALARAAWLARHRSGDPRSGVAGSGGPPLARFLHVSDVIGAALTGAVPATDVSHALKTGADPERVAWRADLLAEAGIEPSALPALAVPGTVAATVPATRSGLAADVPLVLGMTDGCTGQVAAGAVAPGDAVGVLGTTLVLKTVATRRVDGGGIYSHLGPDGLWWPGGASNAGAGALVSRFPGADLAALDEAATRYGPASIVAYPLAGRGERFPFDRADAAGFLTSTPASDIDEYRALLEGVAFTERLGLARLAERGAPSHGPLRAVGGGSRSQAWLRIRATVHGRPVEVTRHPSSGFGAAVLAAAATLHDGLAAATAAMVRTAGLVQPDERERAVLAESYDHFTTELTERGWLPAPAVKAPR